MNDQAEAVLPADQERALATELAETVVGQVAPEELLVFRETAAEYHDNPDRVLHPRRRDEPLGFGLEMELLSPYVLAVAGPVVGYLLSVAKETITEGSTTLVSEWIRGLFRTKEKPAAADAEDSAALTPQQARRVHEITYQRATLLGLPEDRAVLLADAVVGGVQV
ncbi:MAG: hypothetical protein ACLGIF_01365, partial [Actinomycetes bacterium]